jgi:LysR family transcriptional regulator, hypochlorite-specific transcription factor HypT
MESKWLEDFVTLSETRSFSRAAELRNVTQPAFSRRIQALEAWVGTALIDRTSYPTKPTPAGQVFHEQAIEMLGQINGVRTLLRGKHSAGAHTLSFAVPHTLAITFFPQWLTDLEHGFKQKLSTKLSAFNVHDAVLQLVDGGCDLVMIYNHPRVPVHLDPQRYDTLRLGTEHMRPYSQAIATGTGISSQLGSSERSRPKFKLPGTKAAPVPFLSFSSGAYLGRLSDVMLTESTFPQHLKTVFETDMAEVIKMMALAGHGVAFLPESAVQQELRADRLALAGDLSIEMEIRLIRERPQRNTSGEAQGKALLHEVWDYLSARNG